MQRSRCPPRILVVDDNVELAEVVRDSLELEGYEAAAAHDADQALRAFYEFKPDLVLLDMHLPPWNGEQILRAMQSIDRIGCHFVAMSGDSEVAIEGLALLVKPFDLRELAEVVAAHIGRAGDGPSRLVNS